TSGNVCIRMESEELILEIVNDADCEPKEYKHSYLHSTLVLICVTVMIFVIIGLTHVLVVFRVIIAGFLAKKHFQSNSSHIGAMFMGKRKRSPKLQRKCANCYLKDESEVKDGDELCENCKLRDWHKNFQLTDVDSFSLFNEFLEMGMSFVLGVWIDILEAIGVLAVIANGLGAGIHPGRVGGMDNGKSWGSGDKQTTGTKSTNQMLSHETIRGCVDESRFKEQVVYLGQQGPSYVLQCPLQTLQPQSFPQTLFMWQKDCQQLQNQEGKAFLEFSSISLQDQGNYT
ncbi:hypothetical protein GOODEAATRI_010601, partial [Goodea atripinnis]